MKYKVIDLRGQRFGRLTVRSLTNEVGSSTSRIWRCECDCGAMCWIASSQLRTGKTKSCGCLHKDVLRWMHAYKRELKAGNFELAKEIYSNKPE